MATKNLRWRVELRENNSRVYVVLKADSWGYYGEVLGSVCLPNKSSKKYNKRYKKLLKMYSAALKEVNLRNADAEQIDKQREQTLQVMKEIERNIKI